MKKLLLTILILMPAALLWGQQSAVPKRQTEAFEDRHFDRVDLQAAIKYYKRSLSKDPEQPNALYNLANAYRMTSDYKKAEEWYVKAIEHEQPPKCKLFYAQVLLANEKYEEASEWFQKYASIAETASAIQNSILLSEYADQLAGKGIPESIYKIELLDFNSKKLDFSPAFLGNDSTVIFSSTRDAAGKKSKLTDGWTAEGFVDLFFSKRLEDGSWTKPESLPKPLNFAFHGGPLTFTTDYSRAYVTRSDHDGSRGFDEDRNTRLKIYSLDRLEGYGINDRKHWENLQPLPFNNSKYSCAHPTISLDGNTMVFASDQPSSYGNMDLYVVTKEGDTWGEPKNLGETINTEGIDAFPFIHPETNHLYFSSNMHPGFGGLDLFKSPWDPVTKEWGTPINMGVPVNSSDDDFGMVLVEDMKIIGYFTSNRNRETEDDIYYFERKSDAEIQGVVVNIEDGSVIPNASVKLLIGKDENGELFKEFTSDSEGKFSTTVPFSQNYVAVASKEDFITNDEATGIDYAPRSAFDGQAVVYMEMKLIPEACELFVEGRVLNKSFDAGVPMANLVLTEKCSGKVSNLQADETGAYRIPLQKDCDYTLQASKEGFIQNEVSFSTKEASCKEGAIKIDVPLEMEEIKEGLVIELENIYFDFDKYYIRKDAEQDLEEVYALMTTYPNMKGEIGAHTDSRGSHAYNEVLSANRAKSAVEWLIKKGISKDRLTWKGYGETKLRNRCSDDVSCSKIEHQRNRRVEFTVTFVDGKKVESTERDDYTPQKK